MVKRAEGPTELCGTWEFKTLVAADKQLWEISRTAPDSGGYDKTDVTVFFSDGQTIKMRHDIKRHDIDGTVAEHIITFSKWVIKNDEKVKNDPAQIADIQKYINALSNKETAPTIPQQKSGGMRNENELMKLWLHKNGVDCTPMFIWTGSMKGTWRLYNKTMKWTPELRDKLTALGFAGSHGPLTQFSGNGGAFSVFVRNPEVTRQLMEITQQAGQSEGKTRYIKRMKGGNLRGRSIGKQVSGWDYSKGEQYLKTTNISALDRSLGFIKTILEGNPDVTETKRAINALKWAEQNPHTRHAFFLITGIKLPKTQKETQALLEKMTGLPSGKQFVTVGKKVGSGISVKGFGNLTNKKLKELKLEIAVMKNGPVRVRTFVDGKLIRLWHEPTTKQAKESLKKYLLGIKNKQRYRIKQILNGEVL